LIRGNKVITTVNLGLYENGIDFIERSIESYISAKSNTKEYKYATLFLGIGVELILKSILEKAHPVFLLDNIDSTNIDKTITSSKIIPRLQLVYKEKGHHIQNADKENLEAIRLIRNQIIHKEVIFTELPTKVFANTLNTLDRMVKLFFNKTLSESISNWSVITENEELKQTFFPKNFKGFCIGEYKVPCSTCGLESIVKKKNSEGYTCNYCSTDFDNIEKLLYETDLVQYYIEEEIKSSNGKVIELIPLFQVFKSYQEKDKVINFYIEELEKKGIMFHDCVRCGSADYMHYNKDNGTYHCINCGELDNFEKCPNCNLNSLFSDAEGYDYCYHCQENPNGEHCNLCGDDNNSNLYTVKVDVRDAKRFQKELSYPLEEKRYFQENCCQSCLNKLHSLEEDEAIYIN